MIDLSIEFCPATILRMARSVTAQDTESGMANIS